jgi:hypothetical protein
MRLLKDINLSRAYRGKPMSSVEIDEHFDANNIWATILECQRESQEAVRRAFDDGYSLGFEVGEA